MESFESYRMYLFAIAYRMLGSAVDAEELTEVNGQPALITSASDRAFAVLTIEVEAQRVKTIGNIVNPDKLMHV